MDNLGTLGFCPKCNDMLITENGVPKCLNCAPSKRPKHIVKPPPVTEVPTEADFNALVDSKDRLVKGKAKVTTHSHTAQDALDIMRNLPMPKDMKEFRQIQKIIKQLEKLVGENDVN